MQSSDFLLLFRWPSWSFAHNYFCPRVTEFGDFGQVTTCNKLSYDAKISFWQICSTSNAISPGLIGIQSQTYRETANISAVYKKGKKTVTSIYRPMTSVVCKIFESILKAVSG